MSDASSVPVSVLRGGTSRGVFLLESDVPEHQADLDALAVRLVGSPDPLQTDGLGGGRPTTSKVAVVGAADDDPGADIRYRVGNVAVGSPVVDWSGTCGNLTAAAPLFALQEGLVDPGDDDGTLVRMRNRSTDSVIEAFLPTRRGRREVDPDAPIRTRYLDPGGSVLGSSLPTGHALDVFEVDGREVEASLVDVTHPYLFVRASEVLSGDGPWSVELLDDERLAFLERLRATVAVDVGAAASVDAASTESAAVPRLVLVGPGGADQDLAVLAVSMGASVPTVPVSAAMCLAAARLLPGTLIHAIRPADGGTTRIAGPIATVEADASPSRSGDIAWTEVTRTARVVLRGGRAQLAA